MLRVQLHGVESDDALLLPVRHDRG
jgi:hypothetical protein